VQPAQLIPLVLILGAFYFLILRPAKARQRQQLELQRQVEPGATIMTTSGMFGTVTEVEDDAVHVEIAPGTVVRFTKAAVGRVVTEPVDDDGDDAADAADDDAGDGYYHDGADASTHDGDAPASSDVETPDAAGEPGSPRRDDPSDRATG
jgi:preprotein translocase subunit YajC